METNLLRAIKLRVLEELKGAVQAHETYRDKMNCYHKFPYKERPMMGVVLKNASSSRIKLSADDHAGTVRSYVALARAENVEGNFLEWVWEDSINLTQKVINEDVSSQLSGTPTYGTNRGFKVAHAPILSGLNNLVPAHNFRQIYVTVNGTQVLPEFVDGVNGFFILPTAPPTGSIVLVTYDYSKLTPPGRYYFEITAPNTYVINPFYVIKKETVIARTTGSEMTANLLHGNLYGDFDTLYTKKYNYSENNYLVKGTDYSITVGGDITFLQTLQVGTTLYADYRWVGDVMGPYTIPNEFHYDSTVLPGVILSFGNQFDVGSKMVVIVYPQREIAASVRSGHFKMSFDIEVFMRDPVQLPDITDHIIQWLWAKRRQQLICEGITIEEIDPVGESEEPYDTNTGDLYYKNGINMQIMTEWKEFTPALYEILDFDTKLYSYITLKEYLVTNQNQVLELKLVPASKPFEVHYPKLGFARVL